MSERWKYQIKTGLPFGIVMPIIMTLFEWYGTSETFAEAFFTMKFLIKLIVFMTIGVFLIGYSYWRERAKNEMYNKN
jgi:hypothetical protein